MIHYTKYIAWLLRRKE